MAETLLIFVLWVGADPDVVWANQPQVAPMPRQLVPQVVMERDRIRQILGERGWGSLRSSADFYQKSGYWVEYSFGTAVKVTREQPVEPKVGMTQEEVERIIKERPWVGTAGLHGQHILYPSYSVSYSGTDGRASSVQKRQTVKWPKLDRGSGRSLGLGMP